MTHRDSSARSPRCPGFLRWAALLLLSMWLVWFALPTIVPHRTITISVSTNGAPHLFGISLGNTTIRRGVLRVLRQTNVRVALIAPRGGLARTNANALEQDMAVVGIEGSLRGGIK